MPAPHPPEFRQRAVELARLGEQSVGAIAKDLGISESCLRNWMAQADADNGTGKPTASRLSSEERAELAELRKKAKRLETENEILKRAAAYFARGGRGDPAPDQPLAGRATQPGKVGSLGQSLGANDRTSRTARQRICSSTSTHP